MYLQSYEALCRSFFVVVELKAALNVVFSAAKEGWLYASGTIDQVLEHQPPGLPGLAYLQQPVDK
jgi:hypothetical protein